MTKINIEKHLNYIQKLWSVKFGDPKKHIYPANDYQIKRRSRLIQSLNTIDEFINKNHRVIDIGCNTGILSIYCSFSVKSVLGVESNEVCLKKAKIAQEYFKNRQYNLSNLSFKKSSLLTILKEGAKFNCVVAMQVLYHLANEEIEQIGSLFDEKCMIICSAKPEKKESNNNYQLYKVDKLKSFLHKHGFVIRKVKYRKTRWPQIVAFRE